LYSLNGPTFIARFMSLLKLKIRKWSIFHIVCNLFSDEFGWLTYITGFFALFFFAVMLN
jgi:hypothetical protein